MSVNFVFQPQYAILLNYDVKYRILDIDVAEKLMAALKLTERKAKEYAARCDLNESSVVVYETDDKEIADLVLKRMKSRRFRLNATLKNREKKVCSRLYVILQS